jgi:hypothetical protein
MCKNLKFLFYYLYCTKGSVQVRGLVKCLVRSYVLRWEIWNGSLSIGSGAPDLGCEEVRFSLLDSEVDNSAPLSRAHRRQNKHCRQRVTFCLQMIVLRRQLNKSHLPGFQLLIKIEVIYCLISMGRRSSVGIATAYGLDGTAIESRWGRDFPHLSRPALRPNKPPVQWVTSLSRV